MGDTTLSLITRRGSAARRSHHGGVGLVRAVPALLRVRGPRGLAGGDGALVTGAEVLARPRHARLVAAVRRPAVTRVGPRGGGLAVMALVIVRGQRISFDTIYTY